jgi:hypothetical protein
LTATYVARVAIPRPRGNASGIRLEARSRRWCRSQASQSDGAGSRRRASRTGRNTTARGPATSSDRPLVLEHRVHAEVGGETRRSRQFGLALEPPRARTRVVRGWRGSSRCRVPQP